MAMWKCDFKNELSTNPDMRDVKNALDNVSPLEPRNAFYDGKQKVSNFTRKLQNLLK